MPHEYFCDFWRAAERRASEAARKGLRRPALRALVTARPAAPPVPRCLVLTRETDIWASPDRQAWWLPVGPNQVLFWLPPARPGGCPIDVQHEAISDAVAAANWWRGEIDPGAMLRAAAAVVQRDPGFRERDLDRPGPRTKMLCRAEVLRPGPERAHWAVVVDEAFVEEGDPAVAWEPAVEMRVVPRGLPWLLPIAVHARSWRLTVWDFLKALPRIGPGE